MHKVFNIFEELGSKSFCRKVQPIVHPLLYVVDIHILYKLRGAIKKFHPYKLMS